VIEIPVVKRLEPYFKIAEDEANKSLCIRRQYGAVVITENPDDNWFDAAHNKRISTCCGGNTCARDRINTRHGGNVEVGGEIHAETAVLIDTALKGFFILVGFEKGHELLGPDVYPCHSCAMAIKFAGYKHIYIRDKNKLIVPVSVSQIIEYRIQQWEPID